MAMTNQAYCFPILLLTAALLLRPATSADPLYSISSDSKNFTSKSYYERNLVKLFGDLYFKTPRSEFGSGYSGSSLDRAYGLALCRGDVSKKNCQACVVEATGEITNRCPNDRGAIIWYDNCMLKYSGKNFLGKIDNGNTFYLVNTQNVSIDSSKFDGETTELLGKLTEKAGKATNLFAVGEAEARGGVKIYGMAQCSRDRSARNCEKCLENAVGHIPACCGGKQGGRVIGGSCSVRYEIYPFLKPQLNLGILIDWIC